MILSVSDALEKLLEAFSVVAAEQVPLSRSRGRILAEDIHAPLTCHCLQILVWMGLR